MESSLSTKADIIKSFNQEQTQFSETLITSTHTQTTTTTTTVYCPPI